MLAYSAVLHVCLVTIKLVEHYLIVRVPLHGPLLDRSLSPNDRHLNLELLINTFWLIYTYHTSTSIKMKKKIPFLVPTYIDTMIEWTSERTTKISCLHCIFKIHVYIKSFSTMRSSILQWEQTIIQLHVLKSTKVLLVQTYWHLQKGTNPA